MVDSQIYTKVLPNADAAPGDIVTDTGMESHFSLAPVTNSFQTVRSNEQMMQSMKGATSLLGSMNRQMNLPALQRIAMEFEKENDIMDQRQEMMDDAIDDVTGLEDEEEGEEVVNQVLDEIGVDLGQAVRRSSSHTDLRVVNTSYSSARHHRASKAPQCLMGELLRQSAEEIQATTIFKHGWIA